MKIAKLYRTPVATEQQGARTFRWPKCTELSEAGDFKLVADEGETMVIWIEAEQHEPFWSAAEFIGTTLLSAEETQRVLG